MHNSAGLIVVLRCDAFQKDTLQYESIKKIRIFRQFRDDFKNWLLVHLYMEIMWAVHVQFIRMSFIFRFNHEIEHKHFSKWGLNAILLSKTVIPLNSFAPLKKNIRATSLHVYSVIIAQMVEAIKNHFKMLTSKFLLDWTD